MDLEGRACVLLKSLILAHVHHIPDRFLAGLERQSDEDYSSYHPRYGKDIRCRGQENVYRRRLDGKAAHSCRRATSARVFGRCEDSQTRLRWFCINSEVFI